MSPHAWMCEKLIVPAALALAITPVSGMGRASSGLVVERTIRGAERIALLSASSEQNPGELQKAATQPLRPLGNAVQQATPKPLRVTYEDGQLTIIAENSPFSEVMKALRAALGTDIDLPASVADQRIWVHLGPGPARRVIRDLLDGTEFNYVIQASESDADGIRSVLLTQRAKPTSPGERAGGVENAANRRLPGSGPEAATVADSENPSPDPVAPSDPSQAPPPSAVNQSAASASLQNTPSNPDIGAAKAGSQTDQMIQQLQSMYQQRRQLQIQQNQKPTGQN